MSENRWTRTIPTRCFCGGINAVNMDYRWARKQGSLTLSYGRITTKSTRNEKALNRLLDEFEKEQMDRLN
jgi:hypothetical protein